MKWSSRALVCLGSFLALSSICKHLNGNFDTKDLLQPEQEGSSWDTSAFQAPLDARSILSQKFSFLAKGNQAFAFVSEDDQYVLKLFKPYYPNITFLHTSINFTYIPFAKEIYRLFAGGAFKERLHEDLTSYVNAFSSFQKESLVEYLHLTNTTDLKIKLRVFDKNGVLRELPADSTCFLLQRKVTPLSEVLQQLIQEKRTQDAKIVLQGLLELLSRRAELGFYKPTHKFYANFGCIGLETFQLDIGRLLTKEDLKLDPNTANTSLDDSFSKLKTWLEAGYPELIPSFEELITKG